MHTLSCQIDSRKELNGKSGHLTKTAANGSGQIHASAAWKAGTEPSISWRADRRGRHGRLRQEHAALSSETLAGNWRLPSAFHGMEFFAAGKIRHAARK